MPPREDLQDDPPIQNPLSVANEVILKSGIICQRNYDRLERQYIAFKDNATGSVLARMNRPIGQQGCQFTPAEGQENPLAKKDLMELLAIKSEFNSPDSTLDDATRSYIIKRNEMYEIGLAMLARDASIPRPQAFALVHKIN